MSVPNGSANVLTAGNGIPLSRRKREQAGQKAVRQIRTPAPEYDNQRKRKTYNHRALKSLTGFWAEEWLQAL